MHKEFCSLMMTIQQKSSSEALSCYSFKSCGEGEDYFAVIHI